MAAVRAIVELLGASELRHLNLARNPLADGGVLEIASAFARALPLESLDLQSCCITEVGVFALLSSCAHAEKLRAVKLQDNYVAWQETELLALADKLKYLQVLELTENRLSLTTLQRLKAICARNKRAAEAALPAQLKDEIYDLCFVEQQLVDMEQNLTGQDSRLKACGERLVAVDDAHRRLHTHAAGQMQKAQAAIEAERRACTAAGTTAAKHRETLKNMEEELARKRELWREQQSQRASEFEAAKQEQHEAESSLEAARRALPVRKEQLLAEAERLEHEEHAFKLQVDELRGKLKHLQEKHKITSH